MGGRDLAVWSMALQSVCIAVERKTEGSSPGVAVDFYLQSQLVFGLFEGVPLTHMSSMLPIIGM